MKEPHIYIVCSIVETHSQVLGTLSLEMYTMYVSFFEMDTIQFLSHLYEIRYLIYPSGLELQDENISHLSLSSLMG